MTTYRYPCTGNISLHGFGEYLEKEIGKPRRNIQLFTKELNDFHGSEYITLTNSGSSANLVAALVLAEKVKSEGKPLTAFASAFTFPTTISALLLAGFRVRLRDTEPGGFNIDINRLRRYRKGASVIAITHFLGFPCKTFDFLEYAGSCGGYLLQDACETMELRESAGYTPQWAYGDITTYSFYHPHHLSSYGGGAVLCTELDDHILCDSITHWGRACKCHFDASLCHAPEGPAHQFTYERIGVNVEMSELNAAFGRWQLRNWDEIERRRQENYAILFDTLKDNPNLCIWEIPWWRCRNSPFVFPIRLRKGLTVNDAYDILSKEGVEIRTLMGGAAILHPAFKGKVTHDNQKNALAMSRDTFFVGIHHTLPTEDVKAVADIIDRKFS